MVSKWCMCGAHLVHVVLKVQCVCVSVCVCACCARVVRVLCVCVCVSFMYGTCAENAWHMCGVYVVYVRIGPFVSELGMFWRLMTAVLSVSV